VTLVSAQGQHQPYSFSPWANLSRRFGLFQWQHCCLLRLCCAAQVCEPRVLFGMRSDARDMATDSDPEAWMWRGKQTEAVLAKFAREGEQQQPHGGRGLR
jgi:hypothetical protein